MAWTFDLPTALPLSAWPTNGGLDPDFFDEVTNPSNLKVAYDGKNLWYVNKWRTKIIVLDFWGPYDFWLGPDVDVNGFFNRHLCPEDDMIRAGNRGPQLRILRIYDFNWLLAGMSELPNHEAPTPTEPLPRGVIKSITYLNNHIYVSCVNGNLFRIPCDLSLPSDFAFNSTLGNAYRVTETFGAELNSDIVGLGTKVFGVSRPPVLDTANVFVTSPNGGYAIDLVGAPDAQEPDAQSLIWYDYAADTTGSTLIPGTKQLTPRRLATAHDCVYVTAYNELCVYKFDSNGGFLSTIPVNRDVENIFNVDGELWVISSNKGALTFPPDEPDGEDKEVSAYMVSKIDANDAVTNVVGFPSGGAGGGTKNVHFGHSGSHIWLLGKDEEFARVSLNNLRAILSDSGIVQGDDFNFGHSQLTYRSSSGPAVFDTINIGERFDGPGSRFVNLWVSPQHSYQWFDGSVFQTINIPRYLVLFQEGGRFAGERPSILAQRLPHAIKYESEFKINNYVAISSGARRYKGD